MLKKFVVLFMLISLQFPTITFAESIEEYCSSNYKLEGIIPEYWYPEAKYSTFAKAGLWASGVLIYPAIFTYPLAISDTEWRRKQRANKIREKCNPYLRDLQPSSSSSSSSAAATATTVLTQTNNNTSVSMQNDTVQNAVISENLICLKFEYTLDKLAHHTTPVVEYFYIDPDRHLVYAEDKTLINRADTLFLENKFYFTSSCDSANLANDYKLEYRYEVNRLNGHVTVTARTRPKSVSAKMEQGINKFFGITDSVYAQGTGTVTKVDRKKVLF